MAPQLRGETVAGGKSSRRPRLLAPIALFAAAVSSLLYGSTVSGFISPGVPRALAASTGHGQEAKRYGSVIARRAGDRMAYIAVVDVQVKEGQEDAFLKASLANARASKREPSNQRFDVLQSRDDPTRFALVEIYRNANGPAGHKETAQYATWRDTVADMMAVPRSAGQWDTIFPSKASSFHPDTITLERPQASTIDVTHVYVSVSPGREQDFIKATLENAKSSVMEPGNLRFDFLRNVEDPTQFLLVEVYRTTSDALDHKETEHYKLWRNTVASMMAKDRVGKKYVAHFPNIPASWKVAQGVM